MPLTVLVGYHLLSCYLHVLLLSTVVKCRNSVHVYQFFDRVTKIQSDQLRDQCLERAFGISC